MLILSCIINKFDTEHFGLYMLDPENFFKTISGIIFNSFIPRCSWVECVNKSGGKLVVQRLLYVLNSACTYGLTTKYAWEAMVLFSWANWCIHLNLQLHLFSYTRLSMKADYTLSSLAPACLLTNLVNTLVTKGHLYVFYAVGNSWRYSLTSPVTNH